jgi:uncharacterized protein YndB with AHSA1/START domain
MTDTQTHQQTSLQTPTQAPTTHRKFFTSVIAAPADAIFDLITDPARLPRWNRAITDVVDAPDLLSVGSAWRVRFRTFGHTWISRSEVAVLDSSTGRFAYRSQTDDGNPSYADWRWHVRPDRLFPDRERAVVSVAVALHPLTFWREHLLVQMRQPLLRREIHHSLIALEAALHD